MEVLKFYITSMSINYIDADCRMCLSFKNGS